MSRLMDKISPIRPRSRISTKFRSCGQFPPSAESRRNEHNRPLPIQLFRSLTDSPTTAPRIWRNTMTPKLSCSALWGRKALIACSLILTAASAFGAPPGRPKMSRDLEQKNASDMVDVIVQFKQAPSAFHHQKVLGRGGALHRSLDLVNSGAYRMRAGSVKDLADDPDVAYISPDRPIAGTGTWVNDYHTGTINAPAA